MGIAAADQESGIRTWLRLHADLGKADATIAELEARNSTLRQEAFALRNEPFAVERAIRETLALAKPGEIVVRFAPADDLDRFSGERAGDLRGALSQGAD